MPITSDVDIFEGSNFGITVIIMNTSIYQIKKILFVMGESL